ncbi:hypothetical protein DWV37_12355 [Tannerella sp. AF04-6]|uniref:B3/B4 domain-containing protein n=1 Tax=Coprobacter fastidiosus TaxID=1099853 RepID=UPI000ECCB8AA|nr:phenylalanine--tRNA ligase beta subunit-related protein [Coprobacter fastidiosus]RHS43945.1 hypothetical protein DWV37_12355 [Tannerella sp. AF04-6]
MKIRLSISDTIKQTCPEFTAGLVCAQVKNSLYNESLWKEIEEEITQIRQEYPLETINKRETILATRKVYKNLGKDPNRYRPSAEALCRRLTKGMELYHISTLVDLINLVSIRTGYSIGGFDAGKIEGDFLTLGVGKENELFHAIGRGILNIENLPVYRDATGPIGTPTSDEERTKLSPDTTQILIIINGYSGENGIENAIKLTTDLLTRYAYACDIETDYVRTY